MEPSPAAEILAVLGSIKESFFHMLPKLVVALVVLFVGWLVAWSLRALVRRVVERFSKRISAGTTAAAWQQVLADKGLGRIVSSSIYWLVLLVAITVASEVVGLPVLTTYLAALAHYLPRVIAAVAVLFVGVVGGRLISDAAMTTAFRLLPHQGQQLARLVRGIIIGAAILVAMKQLGVDVSLLTNIFLIALAALFAGVGQSGNTGAQALAVTMRGLALREIRTSHAARVLGKELAIGFCNGLAIAALLTRL